MFSGIHGVGRDGWVWVWVDRDGHLVKSREKIIRAEMSAVLGVIHATFVFGHPSSGAVALLEVVGPKVS
jgi:hypothetical protein